MAFSSRNAKPGTKADYPAWMKVTRKAGRVMVFFEGIKCKRLVKIPVSNMIHNLDCLTTKKPA
ncbi:hypothetical protein AL542_15875 [Grimontia hollisae]|nr:hypothetical protein AL542_15875 [Grimontia hollisae]